MAASLESRSPFMDYRVVEFLKQLPIGFKINEIGSKAILREILKKYGHDEIYLNKNKMGFASDIPSLLQNKDIKKEFLTAIESFDHKDYREQKQIALATIKKANLGWNDIDKIWKVAAIGITEKMYGER